MLFFLMIPRPPTSTLFPYTTLFRSPSTALNAIGLLPIVGREVLQPGQQEDRKSTRLNSSHVEISYAVFCLKKKTSVQIRRDLNIGMVEGMPNQRATSRSLLHKNMVS